MSGLLASAQLPAERSEQKTVHMHGLYALHECSYDKFRLRQRTCDELKSDNRKIIDQF